MTSALPSDDFFKSIIVHAALGAGAFAMLMLGSLGPSTLSLKGNSEHIDLVLSQRQAQKSQAAQAIADSSSVRSAIAPQVTTPVVAASGGTFGKNDGVDVSERKRYLTELRAWIAQNQVYPQLSRRMKETGTVMVRFVIQKDGKLGPAEILKTSGHDRLDQAAQSLIAGLSKFKAFPKEIEVDSLPIELPIEYQLN